MACNQSLPITVDIDISVTKLQAISTVDLSVPVLVSSTGSLTPADRIRYYDTLSSVEADWGSTGAAFKAANAFFNQNPRPQTMAVAQVFTTPQSGYLVTAQTGAFIAFTPISDGAFIISIDGDQQTISSLDFTSDSDLDGVALTIQAGLQLVGTGGYSAATVTASNETVNQFTIKSGTTGASSTVSVLTSPGSGTDISGLGFMNGQQGEVIAGYTPTTFTNELVLIQAAASCAGRFVYGWALDAVYRDQQEQLDAAAFAEDQLLIEMALVSNNPLSYAPSDTNNNIFKLFDLGYTKSLAFYHDVVDQYPEMAALATLQSVDYNGLNTALTLKFKNLVGISPVSFPDPETNTQVLNSRRCNYFVVVGNGARTVRQGVQVSASWYADDRTNTDNFVNDLLTNIYNVFLTTPKVPYTSAGITLLFQAEQQICNQYVRNDFIADRIVPDNTSPNGIKTVPAYQIIFPPLQQVTAADREARLLQGNQIILQPSGAIHELKINITITE